MAEKEYTTDDIREYIMEDMGIDEEVTNDIVLFENPSYASAFIGLTHDDHAVYDYEAMVASW